MCWYSTGTQADCQNKQDEYDESDEAEPEEHNEVILWGIFQIMYVRACAYLDGSW